MNIPYFDYVYFDEGGKPELSHSGISVPAINLEPKYGYSTGARLKALKSLSGYTHYSGVARRAIEWCALNDEDEVVKAAAIGYSRIIPAQVET